MMVPIHVLTIRHIIIIQPLLISVLKIYEQLPSTCCLRVPLLFLLPFTLLLPHDDRKDAQQMTFIELTATTQYPFESNNITLPLDEPQPSLQPHPQQVSLMNTPPISMLQPISPESGWVYDAADVSP
ncbi:hypothetical protein DSO57_1033795 [Entomophthora muscae]|uniref:Uncharacterized protein n=1 Tax=Entomophthora muscae TaxID=34485 RepID=A0ACC2REQ9_9FUNG|nr:hypothetical protein DSO57_1033795 [Entomophthora muscae]